MSKDDTLPPLTFKMQHSPKFRGCQVHDVQAIQASDAQPAAVSAEDHAFKHDSFFQRLSGNFADGKCFGEKFLLVLDPGQHWLDAV